MFWLCDVWSVKVNYMVCVWFVHGVKVLWFCVCGMCLYEIDVCVHVLRYMYDSVCFVCGKVVHVLHVV